MKSLKFLLACGCLAAVLPAWAGFTIMGTRVVYHEREGEATVHLQRVTGDGPALLQAWLDDGSPEAKPASQDLPFIVYPTVARLEVDAAQVIRIVRTSDKVPSDRELLLYFNALEIPSEADDAALDSGNALQFALQTRMKFFYRPQSLQSNPDQASAALRFSLHSGDGVLYLRVTNPTPYHITMPNLGVYAARADDAPLAKFKENGIAPMVAPFAQLDVPLTEFAAHVHAGKLSARSGADMQVRYTVINDQGGLLTKSASLNDGS